MGSIEQSVANEGKEKEGLVKLERLVILET